LITADGAAPLLAFRGFASTAGVGVGFTERCVGASGVVDAGSVPL
jgi:hypothetical protein